MRISVTRNIEYQNRDTEYQLATNNVGFWFYVFIAEHISETILSEGVFKPIFWNSRSQSARISLPQA